MVTYMHYRFAQAYGEGAYNSCTYNTCEGQGGGTTTPAPSSGGLADTGVMIAAVVTIACLIALVALVIRFWRRPATPVLQEVPAQEELAGEPETGRS